MHGLGKRGAPVTNLSAVVATGAGSWVECGAAQDILVVTNAATVTSGGTVLVQGNTASDGSGTTFTIATVTVSASGATMTAVAAASVPSAIRTNLSARTDGTYTTTIQSRTL